MVRRLLLIAWIFPQAQRRERGGEGEDGRGVGSSVQDRSRGSWRLPVLPSPDAQMVRVWQTEDAKLLFPPDYIDGPHLLDYSSLKIQLKPGTKRDKLGAERKRGGVWPGCPSDVAPQLQPEQLRGRS